MIYRNNAALAELITQSRYAEILKKRGKARLRDMVNLTP